MTMQQIVDQLNKWAYEYYVLDAPTVADTEYDALYDRLTLLEQQTGIVLPDSPTRRVGGQPLAQFAQHKHLGRLYSLDKAQSFGELQAWVEKVNKQLGKVAFTVELKYDGLTISVTYRNGKLECASTRGNGIVGEDVTEQVKTIRSVPLTIPFDGVCELQGEGIMRLSVLERYNKKHPDEVLKNARNAAAGAIRNLNPAVTAERKLDVVFHSNAYSNGLPVSSQSELNDFFKSCKMATNYVFERVTEFDEIKAIIEHIADIRSSLDFLIDGVVIKVDEYSHREELGYTDKFPKWAIAFKFDAEQASTTLLDVEWQVGRTGKLTPVANLQPVELCGATIRRATLNNVGDILRKGVKKNALVWIRRSNDVIPEVLGAAEDGGDEISVPEFCPSCGSRLEKVGAHLYCVNAEGCHPQIVARISHYASKGACDIDGLSDKTVELLVNNLAVKSVADLYGLTADELTKLDSFKERKATKLVEAIQKSKGVDLARFIYALGLDNVGSVTAKELAKRFGSVGGVAQATVEQLCAIDGIGDVVAEGIVQFFAEQQNAEIVERLRNLGIDPQYDSAQRKGALEGKKVVLTGGLATMTRTQAQRLIEERGGEVSSTVSKSVNLVVAGTDAGSKLDKARAMGIDVIDEAAFISLLAERSNET